MLHENQQINLRLATAVHVAASKYRKDFMSLWRDRKLDPEVMPTINQLITEKATGQRRANAAAAVPSIPRACCPAWDHRDRIAPVEDPMPACVARRVPKNEWKGQAQKAALDKEWTRLHETP